MKWFRHYVSLHRQPESKALMRKLGMEWYARYLIILEIAAETYNGDKSATTFVLAVEDLKTTLRVVGDQWQTTLRLVGEYQGFTFKVVGEFINFEIPIIAELFHKDSTSSVARRARLGPVAGQDLDLDIDEDKEETKSKSVSPISFSSAQNFQNSFAFDFKSLFESYVNSRKKSASLVLLSQKIRTQADYDRIKLSIENYKTYVTKECIEFKYQMSFPTFLAEWEDWENPDMAKSKFKPLASGDAWLAHRKAKQDESA